MGSSGPLRLSLERSRGFTRRFEVSIRGRVFGMEKSKRRAALNGRAFGVVHKRERPNRSVPVRPFQAEMYALDLASRSILNVRPDPG
jgi:hypothetical protein